MNKIVIIDDHKIFVDSLRLVLESNNYEVKNFSNPELAFKYLKSVEVDLIISDVEMPEMNGLDLIKKIKNEVQINDLKILILTSHSKIKVFEQFLNLGIDGYLSKSTSQVELLSVLKKIINGEKYYDSSIYNEFLRVSKTFNVQFTNRELDVLKLLVDEKTTSEIAEILGISSFTVEGHRKNLLQKTNSKNVVGLIKYVFLNNLF